MHAADLEHETTTAEPQRLEGWVDSTWTDLFAGAGGSSTGVRSVPGQRIVMAANHWDLAIRSHSANHPDTDHDCADLSQVDPRRYPRTTFLWISPECTNHALARGVKQQRAQQELAGLEQRLPDEAANRSRATMWDVVRFTEYHQYEAVIVENVVEASRWVMFPAWLQAMQLLGYDHETVWLNSMHAQAGGVGAPQSRDRMYVVFWRRGNRRPDLDAWTRPRAVCEEHGEVYGVQSFKRRERWGKYRAQYLYRCPRCAQPVEPAWMPASSVIDWSLRGQRIGDRKRPLAAKTRKRIELGVQRHWGPIIAAAAGNTYDAASGKPGNYLRAWPIAEPLQAQTTTVQHGLAIPPIAARAEQVVSTALVDDAAIVVPLRNNGIAKPVSHPLDTVAANGNHHALVMRNNEGGAEMTTAVTEPLRTLTTSGHQSLLSPTRLSLDVDDVEFRMFEPHEILLGMAFPREYIVFGNKAERVKQGGNAVTPPAARDLVCAVVESLRSGGPSRRDVLELGLAA